MYVYSPKLIEAVYLGSPLSAQVPPKARFCCGCGSKKPQIDIRGIPKETYFDAILTLKLLFSKKNVVQAINSMT